MCRTWYVLALVALFSSDIVRCAPENSFNLEGRGWLKLHATPETWENAFLRCHNEGAVLASPLDYQLAATLQTMIKESGVNSHFFLGTHALFDSEHLSSVEGVPLSKQAVQSPSNARITGHCLSMSDSGDAYYAACQDRLPFICYKKFDNTTMSGCGTYDNNYHYNVRTGSCYKVHSERVTWDRAFSTCASEGGHLVIINNAEEASVIRGLFPEHHGVIGKYEQFHIGLVAWGSSRTWMTIHGQRIEDVFNLWEVEDGQPDNDGGFQYRATFRRLRGKMDDIAGLACYAMFVCEKTPERDEEVY